MILKASARGGGHGLAAHLLRIDDNEHIELHDLRGFSADDLRGAFKEAQAISQATKCRQYLFSLSLNPPETADVGVEAFEATIDQIERKLGFEGLPRAVVFHEKEGRRHAHCVWSRIDTETMTARPVPFFKTKLREMSRELYLEHGWKMPRGLANKADRDPLNYTLAEWQQAKRAGYDPKTLKASIQDAWAISDSRASFEHALKERGFWLARGDRRSFVAIDYTGEVHSVSRAIGQKAKDVRARLGNEEPLPSASTIKAEIGSKMSQKMRDHVREAKTRFSRHAEALELSRAEMVSKQREERRSLAAKQSERGKEESIARQKALPRGLKGIWSRVTGQYRKQKALIEDEAKRCAVRDRDERNAVVAKQLAERRTLQRAIKMQRSVQADLLRDLRREIHRYIALGLDGPEPTQRNRRRRNRGLER